MVAPWKKRSASAAPAPTPNLAAAIRARVVAFGGADLQIPPREPFPWSCFQNTFCSIFN